MHMHMHIHMTCHMHMHMHIHMHMHMHMHIHMNMHMHMCTRFILGGAARGELQGGQGDQGGAQSAEPVLPTAWYLRTWWGLSLQGGPHDPAPAGVA